MTERFNYQRNPLNIGGPRWGGPPYNDINALVRANEDLRDSVHMLRRRINGLLEERQRYIHLDLFVKYKLEAEQKYKELEERYKQLEAEKKTEEQKQEMENPKDASVKVKPDKEAQSQKGVEEMLEQECKHMKEEHKGEEEQLEQLKKNYKVLLQNYTNLMELHGQRKCSEQETDATKDQKNQEKQEKMEVEEKEKPEKKEIGKWRLFGKFFAERGSEEGAGL